MKIFLSYKREDQVFVEELRSRLIDWGYGTWMDKHDIPKGAYWPDEIDKGLRESTVVIGVMSPRAVESRNVKNEWDWTIVNGTRLILLMLEKCYVPMNYVSINYIDFTKDKSSSYEQLKAGLTRQQTSMPADPYREYLQQLYERINTFLAQKIIARQPDDETMPEPLRLRSERAPNAVDALFEKRDAIDPLFAIGGIEQDEPQQVYDDFERAFRYYEGRMLLLGEPGAGKTITLLHVGRDAVVRRMQNPSLPLPILGIVPTWDAEKQPLLAVWLSSSYGAPDNVPQLIEAGKALLLLDGLDELGEERENSQTNEQYDPRKRFMEIIPANNQIIVTCRVKDYEGIGKKIALRGAVRLKPLDDMQMRAYLAEHSDLWAAVQADTELREILRTPLLLSFFAFAYRDISEEERQQLRDLSHSPSDLRDKIFEAYVWERYKHEERKLTLRAAEVPFKLDEIYEILGWIGLNGSLAQDESLGMEFSVHTVSFKLSYEEAHKFVEFLRNLHILTDYEEISRFVHLLLFTHFVKKYCLKNIYNLEHLNLRGDKRRHIILANVAWVLCLSRDENVIEPILSAIGALPNSYSANSKPISKSQFRYIMVFVARSMQHIGEGAIKNLAKHIFDPDERISATAITALGYISSEKSTTVLIDALLSSNSRSQFIVNALKHIGTPEALMAVEVWRRSQS